MKTSRLITGIFVGALFFLFYYLWKNKYFALNAPNAGSSANTGIIATVTGSSYTPTPVGPTGNGTGNAPNSVTNVTANFSNNQVVIGWLAPVGGTAQTGYRILRRTGSNAYSVLATVASSGLSYTDTTVSAGVTYDYQVVAYNNVGDAVASSTATVVVPASNAYNMMSIDVAESSWSPQRWRITPTEQNRPAGALNYTVRIKDSNGNLVYDFGNPASLDTAQYASIDFTPNNQLAPVNSRITVPGTYQVELTCGAITRSKVVVFNSNHLILA
ncbi:fibronectin type III domain-containing protein [Runella limosa]|uniref:fibronectin type III domain-containing protein n=1 Tax=Runella limosa TaxID=370978 RepID=UPI000425F0D1|nr:hypothetical protein [Runella limosa]